MSLSLFIISLKERKNTGCMAYLRKPFVISDIILAEWHIVTAYNLYTTSVAITYSPSITARLISGRRACYQKRRLLNKLVFHFIRTVIYSSNFYCVEVIN